MEEPKLVFDLFPSSSRRADSPAGTVTPPIRLPGAVPFLWEEAPGRPKQKAASHPPLEAAGPRPAASECVEYPGRPLSLPPRVLSASASLKKKMTTAIRWDASGIENLDDNTGPNSSSSSSSSSGSLPSFKSLSSGSLGWHSAVGGGRGSGDGLAEEVVVDGGKGERRNNYNNNNVNFLRCKRRRTAALANCVASFAASHFWGSVLGRLKQAVVPRPRDPKI